MWRTGTAGNGMFEAALSDSEPGDGQGWISCEAGDMWDVVETDRVPGSICCGKAPRPGLAFGGGGGMGTIPAEPVPAGDVSAGVMEGEGLMPGPLPRAFRP